MASKQAVADFWSEASCGENLYLADDDYAHQAAERYRLEPFIEPFLEASRWRGKDVLEIGVGLGADHERLALAGARLSGIDLTQRAVDHTAHRLASRHLKSQLRTGDAENLPFADNSFDCVYSWGVIHHTPNTPKAAREILRILRPGGTFKVMIYHKWSVAGLMLWLRYGLAAGRPFTPLASIYSKYLESPGTKAYTINEAKALFAGASSIEAHVELTHAELLESAAGQRHRGVALAIAKSIWPRWFLRRAAKNYGLFLLIHGRK